MKTVAVIDPELKSSYRAILCTKVVQNGEFVELRLASNNRLLATGKTVNVRVNPAWPSTWLYDVTL